MWEKVEKLPSHQAFLAFDSDANHAGQQAARRLAQRLAAAGRNTTDTLRRHVILVLIAALRLRNTNRAKSTGKELRRRVFQILLLAALELATPPVTPTATNQMPPEQEPTESSHSGRAFRAKYVKGDAWFRDDERFKVSVGKQGIVLEAEAKRRDPLRAIGLVARHSDEPNAAADEMRGPFFIPLAAVTEASHAGVPEHLTDKLFGNEAFYEPCAGGDGDPRGVPVCLPLLFTLWVGLQPYLPSGPHRMAGEQCSHREIVSQVSKRDFREFLADIQTARGKPCVDNLPEKEEEAERKIGHAQRSNPQNQ